MTDSYLDVAGRIFDIQRFSVHDGTGIRTIVFLKGCLFRCMWCCNPESQEAGIETMLVDGKEKTIGYDTTVGEVMEQVEKDRHYYRRSGGGLTLSGGECMCQRDFAHGLLAAAKKKGLSTAIETTAALPYETVEMLLPVTDTLLLDIKHMDAGKHVRFIGQDNRMVLENAARIADAGAHIIVRVPVIPGFNATREEIGAIAEFAGSIGVKRMHLLPYHRLGRDKYAGLGRDYPMGDTEPPEEPLLRQLLKAVTDRGLTGQIGG